MTLITKQDALDYFRISGTIDDVAFGRYVNEAQLLDLQPLLGNALFYDLLGDSESEKYQRLLLGGSYAPDGAAIGFSGLRQVLSYFAYARYIVRSSITDTAFGLVTKNFQDAQPRPDADRRQLAMELRQDAHVFFESTARYLGHAAGEYPLWKAGCGQASATAGKIRFDVL